MNQPQTYLIALFLWLHMAAYGQQNPGNIPVALQASQSLINPMLPYTCGTVATPDPGFSASDFDAFQQVFDQHMQTGLLQAVTIPVKAHIVRTTSGTGGLSIAALNSALSTANARFANANLNFTLCGSINYIDNTNFYNFNSSTDEGPMVSANNVPNVVNIYFVNSINGGSLGGYAYFPWLLPNDLVVMDYNVSSMGNVLAHELGHYFGLYHTHETFLGVEYVPRINCTTAGDLLCDTEADPNLGLYPSTVTSSCQYIGNLIDPLGYFYVPDPNNAMSYAPPGCITTFTSGQLARIAYYQQGRAYLNCSGGGGGGTGNGCIGGVQYPASTLTPTSSWQTQSQLFAGRYALFNVVSGTSYTFSLCSADGGSAPYDSELTLIRNSNLLELDYADDVCGDDAAITWTATFTGTVRVLVSQYSCTSNTTSTTLAYRSGSGGGVSMGADGCIGGTQYPASTLTPTSSWQTQSQLFAGRYALFNVIAGTNYTFSLCSADGGSAPYDSELTLIRNSNLTELEYADDVCGTNAAITWTATFTGTLRVLISEYSCQSNTLATTLAYRSSSSGGGNLPNLTFVPPPATSVSVNGSQMQVTVEVQNNGTASSSLCKLMYFVLDTSTFALIRVDSVNILPLSPGASQLYSSANIDITPLVGSPDCYYPGFWIDFDNVVIESNDSVTNNAGYWSVAQVCVPSGPPPPIAAFSASSTSICAGNTVTFTNTSTGANSYTWDFGGGAPASSATSPTVTFNTPGTYTITLTATGAGGSDTEVKANYLTVHAPPTVALSGPSTTCTTGGPILLSFSPTGGIFSGTGVNSSGQFNPAVGPGTYVITYAVTQNGCSSNAQHTIVVNACNTVPVAIFSANLTTVPANSTITLDATFSTGTITSYEWLFPGATPSTASGSTATTTYANTGLYDVTLIVSGPAGSDTLTRAAYIAVHPFHASPTFQSASVIGQVQIQYLPAEFPDMIAAFDPNGNCAGTSPVIMSNGIAYFNLPIYGNDSQTPQDEGIDPGETFSLQLWDASQNEILWNESPGNTLSYGGWFNNNGAPLPAYNDPNTVFQFLRVVADTIVLNPGWNQISTDVVPADSTPGAIFAGLNPGNLEYATGFQATNGGLPQAVSYDPNGLPIFNSLTELRKGYAYWVKVANADTLIVFGDAVPASYKRDLDAGWNMFGYMPQTPAAPATYLANLVSSNNLIYVTGFDQGSQFYDPFLPPIFSDLTQLRNSFGYWLKVNTATGGTQYRYGQTGTYQLPTPIFDFLRGRGDLPEAAIGQQVAVIQTATGDTLATMEVLPGGYLATTAIYGDDPATTEYEGLMPGDSISFSWSNMRADEEIQFWGEMLHVALDLHFTQTTSLDNEIVNPVRVQVFPNPAKDQVNLELFLPESAELAVSVCNQLGQPIARLAEDRYPSGQHRFTWSGSDYPEGLYLMRITVDGKVIEARRFILQN